MRQESCDASAKRGLIQCQKRPNTVPKETQHSAQRGLRPPHCHSTHGTQLTPTSCPRKARGDAVLAAHELELLQPTNLNYRDLDETPPVADARIRPSFRPQVGPL
jgi:hypothetical protein